MPPHTMHFIINLILGYMRARLEKASKLKMRRTYTSKQARKEKIGEFFKVGIA